MQIRLAVLSVILTLAAGCSTYGPHTSTSTRSMEFGDIHPRDPLLDTQCRVPCTISPGPGCC
jgi:hypothetical protein